MYRRRIKIVGTAVFAAVAVIAVLTMSTLHSRQSERTASRQGAAVAQQASSAESSKLARDLRGAPPAASAYSAAASGVLEHLGEFEGASVGMYTDKDGKVVLDSLVVPAGRRPSWPDSAFIRSTFATSSLEALTNKANSGAWVSFRWQNDRWVFEKAGVGVYEMPPRAGAEGR